MKPDPQRFPSVASLQPPIFSFSYFLTISYFLFLFQSSNRNINYSVWYRVWRIYSNIRIFLLIQIFIRIFVCFIFWIRIYLDIRSCQLFGYEYIRIFVRSKILIRIYSNICSNPFSDSNNVFCLISMDITLCSWIFCW